ncbi:probable RNA-directed DNA polymerase from transposon BS [Trichonephila clavipes]|nr:probable RNA-directed DNA polymerase from transposon BS [Trichonephila clavipes]
MENHLSKLKVQNIYDLESETRGQASSERWRYERSLRLSSSFFKEIACRKKSTPCSKLVMRIVYGRDLCNAAMKYGLANEEIARKQYERGNIQLKILKLRHFPRNWKTAIVFPINKPGKNKKFPDSYRPISLLSSLSKIAEHIILNRINQFINDTNFLNPNQYGFTKQPTAQTHRTNLGWFPERQIHWSLLLDIQKAFDRVWISGLIYKLITNNFPAPLIRIINSYLVNRIFKVRVNNTFSLPYRVNIGVTQGSLLAPVLFNIYLNDIPSHPQTMLNLYADDTVILATFKNHKSITLALNKHLALLEN